MALSKRDGNRDQRTVLEGRSERPNMLGRRRLQRVHKQPHGHAGKQGIPGGSLAVPQLDSAGAAVGPNVDHRRVHRRDDIHPRQYGRCCFPKLSGSLPGVLKDILIHSMGLAAHTPDDRPDSLVGPVACQLGGVGDPRLSDITVEEQVVPVATELQCAPFPEICRLLQRRWPPKPGPHQAAESVYSAAQSHLGHQIAADQRVAHEVVVDQHGRTPGDRDPLVGRQQGPP